jgi:prepilin-type N-terminal cleavage/methylation domain-containing protein
MRNGFARQSGFTLVEIMIVVAIIGLLAAIAIPNFVKARKTAQANACINNLRIIDAAQQQYALEVGNDSGATSVTLAPYIGRGAAGSWPRCPAGGTYVVTPGSKPTCTLGETLGPGFYHELRD